MLHESRNDKKTSEPKLKPPTAWIDLVSSNSLQSQLIESRLTSKFAIRCRCHTDLAQVRFVEPAEETNQICLFDCLNLDVEAIDVQLSRLGPVPDHIAIALFNVGNHPNLSHLIKHHRIKGIFFAADSLDAFEKGFQFILGGQMWLTRKMLSDCATMFKASPYSQVDVPIDLLTRREQEILKHVACGESNQEIADSLKISMNTVKTHLYNIYRKINVPNRLQAAIWATAKMDFNRNA